MDNLNFMKEFGQTDSQNQTSFQKFGQLTEQDDAKSVTDVQENQTIQEFPQLAEPTYWLSYEYEKLSQEVKKLHEKIDLVVSIVKKKPRKNTLTEVNTKVDCIIEQLDKKRKIEPKEGEK